jgi:serine/threonine protein kinase
MSSTISFSSEDSLSSLFEDKSTSSYVPLKAGQIIKGQGNSTYEIISLLGDGASKCVYLAKNIVGKCVAINCTGNREVSSENTLLKRLRKLQHCTYILLPTLFSKGTLEKQPLFFQIARAYDSDLFTLNEAVEKALNPKRVQHEYTTVYKDHTLCQKLPLFQKMLTKNIFQVGSAFFSAKGILRHLRKYELEHVDLHSGNIFINVHKKTLTITKLVLADWDFAQTAPAYLSCDAIKMGRILDEMPILIPDCPLRAEVLINPNDSVSKIYKIFQAGLNAMDQISLILSQQLVSHRA